MIIGWGMLEWVPMGEKLLVNLSCEYGRWSSTVIHRVKVGHSDQAMVPLGETRLLRQKGSR